MSGGNFYQQRGPQPGGDNQPQQGYPQQPQPYPQQHPYPQQQQQQYQQPYGQAYAQPMYGAWAPPAYLSTEYFGGFWVRLLAIIIDGLVLMIPSMLLSFAVMAAFGFSPGAMFNVSVTQTAEYQVANNISSALQFLLAWPYYALMHSKKGATVGKLALGLRVVEDNGMYPSFARATGRYFATIISGIICLIGYIMTGFHGQKRSLHDIIAGTYVLRKEYVNPQQLAQV